MLVSWAKATLRGRPRGFFGAVTGSTVTATTFRGRPGLRRTGAASAARGSVSRGDADGSLSFFPRRRVTGLGYGAQYKRAVDELRCEAVPAVQAECPA